MVIVAATDGETVPDPVVSVAHELAEAADEELHVLHVMPEERHKKRLQSESGTLGSILAPNIEYDISGGSSKAYDHEQGKREAESVARDVTRETLDTLVDVSFHGRIGNPTQEILRATEKHDARYLVIGGRKRSPVGKAVFGSITQSVLLEADLPVMTVMQSEEE